MAFAAVRPVVAVTPTRLDATPERDAQVGKSVMVRNRGSVPVYLGGPDVTADQGFQLDPGETAVTQQLQAEALWAVTDSATCLCHVLQQGV